jgi:hypothetical protein
VVQTLFPGLKRCGHAEYRFASLNGNDPSGGEASTIPDSINLIEDRDRWVARAKKISMK